MQQLKGKVAVVTGASRGAGRGIALELGEAGATVYVTGRSIQGKPSIAKLPGTIDETAAAITARGGVGIPVRCDHTVDAEVEALFQRIQQEHDRLDLLVNNVFGGNERSIELTPFWQQPLEHWHGMFTAGVRAHIVATRYAMPLMLPHHQGLIINTTFSDRGKYLDNFFYDLAKHTLVRMAFGMHQDLKAYNIAAVALSPGFMRTEAVLSHYNTDEQHWQSVPDLQKTETPHYVGRAVVALATDVKVMQKSGNVLTVGELAQEYGFTDIDGRFIPPFTSEPLHAEGIV
jgi:NAD(P)-dependent dehydrogenase (short-subunit alcohol dehydrogenase family)